MLIFFIAIGNVVLFENLIGGDCIMAKCPLDLLGSSEFRLIAEHGSVCIDQLTGEVEVIRTTSSPEKIPWEAVNPEIVRLYHECVAGIRLKTAEIKNRVKELRNDARSIALDRASLFDDIWKKWPPLNGQVDVSIILVNGSYLVVEVGAGFHHEVSAHDAESLYLRQQAIAEAQKNFDSEMEELEVRHREVINGEVLSATLQKKGDALFRKHHPDWCNGGLHFVVTEKEADFFLLNSKEEILTELAPDIEEIVRRAIIDGGIRVSGKAVKRFNLPLECLKVPFNPSEN